MPYNVISMDFNHNTMPHRLHKPCTSVFFITHYTMPCQCMEYALIFSFDSPS